MLSLDAREPAADSSRCRQRNDPGVMALVVVNLLDVGQPDNAVCTRQYRHSQQPTGDVEEISETLTSEAQRQESQARQR